MPLFLVVWSFVAKVGSMDVKELQKKLSIFNDKMVSQGVLHNNNQVQYIDSGEELLTVIIFFRVTADHYYPD